MTYLKNLGILAITFLFCQQAWSQATCYQSLSSKDLTIRWEAYKTPQKAGVWFSFQNFSIKGTKKAKSLKELLVSQNISINASEAKNIASGDAGRDANIANFFFKTFAPKTPIKGTVKEVTENKINLEIEMNGMKRVVPLSYTLDKNTLTAKGYLDVLDFKLQGALDSLNKVCGGLHEGKTWTDVQLEIKAQLRPC